MERFEGQPSFPSEFEIEYEKRNYGASQFRAAESDYYSIITKLGAIRNHPIVVSQKNLLHPDVIDTTLVAAELREEMDGLRDRYHLIVGGENGRFYVGEKHSFNSQLHILNEQIQLQEGDPLVVTQSQIATRIDDKEHVLYHATFAPAELDKNNAKPKVIFVHTIPMDHVEE